MKVKEFFLVSFYFCFAFIPLGCSTSNPSSPEPTTVTAHDFSADQTYWDGKVDSSVPDDASCVSLAEYYNRPELMAIGDSLFNGVQSLRINWWLSEWSTPTLVAIRLKLLDEYAADRKGPRTFHGPQYPTYEASAQDTQDYGFNLEKLPGNLGFVTIPREQALPLSNLVNDWRPPNHRAMVDNIAFAGSTTTDMLEGTSGNYRAAAKKDLPKLAHSSIFNGPGLLAKTFFNANAAFVLNPMHAPCLESQTSLQQVELRKPRRLLVNIGANDGLWQMALLAKPVSDLALAKSIGPNFKTNMKKIIDKLSKIPHIENIYINGLPLPSQTANMVPTPDGQTWNPNLLANAGGLNAVQMAEADRMVKEANSATFASIEAANKEAEPGYPQFAFVDIAAALGRYDYKRCLLSQAAADCIDKRYKVDAHTYGMPFTQYFDNRPLLFDGPSGARTGPAMQPNLNQGGLMSFDNMHLSTVGYGIFAQAIDKKIGSTEHGLPKIDDARCKGNSKEPGYSEMKHGDCVELLTTPGYAFSDRTQRNFVFDRLGGARETKNLDFLRALAGFLYKWIK